MQTSGLASEGSTKKAHVNVDEIQQLVDKGSHTSREEDGEHCRGPNCFETKKTLRLTHKSNLMKK